jgi:hypothetical protein
MQQFTQEFLSLAGSGRFWQVLAYFYDLQFIYTGLSTVKKLKENHRN